MNKLLTKTNYSTTNSRVISWIVIHYTANNGDTAKGNCLYFENEYRGASAHYFVDENEIWQCVEDKDIAWHCGTKTPYNACRNANSIGIELCSRKDENGVYYFKEETVNNAIKLVKELMRKYSIETDHICRHYDVSRKRCPEPYVRDEKAWKAFLSRLEEKPMTEDEAKKIIKEKCGFDDNTMFWLSRYIYHEPLFIKWAESYKK